MQPFSWRNQKILLVIIVLILISIEFMARALASYDTLRFGDHGNDVRKMQQALYQLGYLSSEADGKFGSQTEAAVRCFQQKNSLEVDGVAGRATLELLYHLDRQQSTQTVAMGNTILTYGFFRNRYDRIDASETSERIQQLQQALKCIGYDLTIDGKFGKETQKAVLQFQKRYSLQQDGIAGKNTLQLLDKLAISYNENAFFRNLRKGDAGKDVLTLQRYLSKLGYYHEKQDGKFGAKTEKAVKKFQQNNGLDKDGIVGKQTLDKLTTLMSSTLPEATPTLSPTVLPIVTPEPNHILKKNTSGNAVISLQRALAFLDYRTSTLGVYDNTTIAGVRDFQKRNGLSVDGIAGDVTLNCLYSGHAIKGAYSANISLETGKMNPPDRTELQILHWYRDIRPVLHNGQQLLIYDPATGLAWTLRIMSRGAHCDVEPLTSVDTAIMYRAFGNQNDWGPKGVYVLLPDGRWTIAGTHNFPHGGQTIKNNNFDGQNCVHFLRTMSEAQRNDPKDGMRNQRCIRRLWKTLTGIDIGNDII